LEKRFNVKQAQVFLGNVNDAGIFSSWVDDCGDFAAMVLKCLSLVNLLWEIAQNEFVEFGLAAVDNFV
jgi:hypothetical protein